ncbi:MAG: HNH endonuclease [Blastocatellia bacterium]
MISDPTRLLSSNPDVERFYSNVKLTEANHYNGSPCWLWQGRKVSTGYGYLIVEGYQFAAHRFALQIIAGISLYNKQSNHLCHNRACCNPAHLYAGTQQQNMRDMYKAKRNWHVTSPQRAAKGDRNGSRSKPEMLKRGTEVNTAKLTPGKVRLARALNALDSQVYPTTFLGKLFGVNHTSISSAIRFKTWKHIA